MGNGMAWHHSYQGVHLDSARSCDIGWLGFHTGLFHQEKVRIGAGFVMACMRLCIPPVFFFFFVCLLGFGWMMEDMSHAEHSNQSRGRN
jgi:hypothetical protein